MFGISVLVKETQKSPLPIMLCKEDTVRTLWGTVPRVGNVAQPPLRKASGERGWQAGPMSMDRFSSGTSGLHCILTAMRLALAKTPSP